MKRYFRFVAAVMALAAVCTVDGCRSRNRPNRASPDEFWMIARRPCRA